MIYILQILPGNVMISMISTDFYVYIMYICIQIYYALYILYFIKNYFKNK